MTMTTFRRAHIRFPMLALAITLLAATGCRKGITPIKTLLDDPSRYDNHQVRVAGEVIHGAGLLGYGAYQVRDDTGTLTVVSRGGGAPREGAEVVAEGTFRALFTLGPQSGAVLMETNRYTR
jgi:hypothetical protein